MKIVLANDTEYQATSASLTEDDQLCITLTELSDPLNETRVRKSLTLEAMSSVKFYKNDTEYTVYENYVLLDSYKVKINEESFDMTLYFNKYIDNKRVETLEKKCNVLFDVTKQVLTELVPGIKLGI